TTCRSSRTLSVAACGVVVSSCGDDDLAGRVTGLDLLDRGGGVGQLVGASDGWTNDAGGGQREDVGEHLGVLGGEQWQEPAARERRADHGGGEPPHAGERLRVLTSDDHERP